MRRAASALLAAVTLFLVSPAPSAQGRATRIDAAAVRGAIDRALQAAPLRFEPLLSPAQTGVRVLNVDVRALSDTAEQVTIDLSQRALTYDPSGDVEAVLDRIITSTAAATTGVRDVRYRILVDGLPLDRFVSRVAPRAVSQPLRVADGSRVLVSGGHGWYWDSDAGAWRLQRDYYWNIVEDLVNWEIATYLWEELRSTNLEARPARRPDRDPVAGPSGNPQWQESAKYFIQSVGAPPDIWDVGANDYNKDINSRPLYSNWIDAAALVSIHNNGGGGTGTETWYDETNGFEDRSRRLAQMINDRLVGEIRSRYKSDWPDRGLRSCNGCKGENRLAARPAVIVEIAFMDTKVPDNAALHDDAFKRLVARAIRDAIADWAAED
jgi:N-acetylmuramoyl-L-alanine amidase